MQQSLPKSLFILRYIDEPELRMSIEKILNGIEQMHRFTYAVSVGSPREFFNAEKEDQQLAEACKRLIKNCIVCWNYLYLSQQFAGQLDNSIQSKIIALAFSMAAEIERDLISQRTKEALRFKKEQGVTLGRPKGPGKSKLDIFRPEIESLLTNGSTQKFIAHRYRTAEANLHNWLKKRGLKTAKSHAP